MGAAIEPRRQPIHSDRRSDREVLQACFRQAPVATRAQPKGADTLGERPFNPRPFVLLCLPLLRALLLPDGLEGLMLALWAQRHMAWGSLRFGTSGTARTIPTGCMGTLDADDRMLPAILARAPRGARLA